MNKYQCKYKIAIHLHISRKANKVFISLHFTRSLIHTFQTDNIVILCTSFLIVFNSFFHVSCFVGKFCSKLISN